MQKIKKIKGLPHSLLSRVIIGGSQPRHYHIRFIGKSPSSPDLPEGQVVECMIENEFICHSLANIVGVNVPEFFVEKYEGGWYFFSRDIDPRPDSEPNFHYSTNEELAKVDKLEIALVNAFNIWVVNEDIICPGRRNMILANNKIYMIDFANALFGINKDGWKEKFNSARDNKEHARKFFIYEWSSINCLEFEQACEIIKSINDFTIDSIIRKALNIGLINEEKHSITRDFLIERKGKILELVR